MFIKRKQPITHAKVMGETDTKVSENYMLQYVYVARLFIVCG